MKKLNDRREPSALRAIGVDDLETAKLLLCEGFPNRSTAFWDQALDRLQRLGSNAAAGVPFGYFMLDGDVPVGVVLTPASLRHRPDGVRTIVNFSSWYIRPDHRWRASVMLRAILRAHDAMFTDLTPTDEVRRMLTAFGFTPLNTGTAVHALALSVLRPARKAVVRDLSASPGEAIPAETRDLLEAHRAIGCIAAVLEADGRSHSLMLKPRRHRGLPAATLIHSSSNEALARHFPALARYLVRRGILLLQTDKDALPGLSGQVVRPFGVKFAKPHKRYGVDPDTTDYIGSELCILDL